MAMANAKHQSSSFYTLVERTISDKNTIISTEEKTTELLLPAQMHLLEWWREKKYTIEL